MANKSIDVYAGTRPRDLPLYSVAEASRIIRIHPATLRTRVLEDGNPLGLGEVPGFVDMPAFERSRMARVPALP